MMRGLTWAVRILMALSVALIGWMFVAVYQDTHSPADKACVAKCKVAGYTDGFDNGGGCFCNREWQRLDGGAK